MKITYQDYEKATDKLKFITEAIQYYKASYDCYNAHTAQSYFDGRNHGIMNLKPLRVEVPGKGGVNVDFAKIPSNIFKRLVLQVCNYQLSNGIIVNDTPIDEVLGAKASKKILTGAIYSMVHGVGYAFINDKKLEKIYRATEMFTLDDEVSGHAVIAIHFWSIENYYGEQQYAQIFEQDGVSKIKYDGKGYELVEEKKPYVVKIRKDALGSEVVGYENPDRLPFVKLHVNDNGESELTLNIKAKIDNLDEIVSRNATFVNKTSMIFWLINTTGYGDAESIGTMIKEIEGLGIAVNEDDGLNASPQVLNPNVEPRLATKQALEDDIYKDFMALNSESLTKGNLTATAINASSNMLKMKASELYYFISDFLTDVYSLLGIDVESVTMKEDTLSNDLEYTQMIMMAREDLTRKKTLQLLPFIEEDEIEELLNEWDEENYTSGQTVDTRDSETDFTSDSMSEEDVKGEVQATTGKTLNGAQTQSLLSVMEKFSDGKLSLQQAINILTVSIGVSKEEARAIIEGLE